MSGAWMWIECRSSGRKHDAGALLDHGLALLDRPALDAVVEAVLLLAGDADDHRPGGVVVRRRLVAAERRVHVEREAMVFVLGHAVEAGLELAAGRGGGKSDAGNSSAAREADQALLDLLEALPGHALTLLDGAHIRYRAWISRFAALVRGPWE